MDLSLCLRLAEATGDAFDREMLAQLFSSMGTHGLLAPRLDGSVRAKRGGSFTVGSGDELAAAARNWPDRVPVWITTPAEDYEATFQLNGSRCEIDLFCYDRFIAPRADRLLAGVAAVLRALPAGAEGWRVEYGTLSMRNFSYPRLRPGRVPRVGGRGNLIDVFDLRTAASPDDQHAITAIRDNPLPETARRTVAGSRILVEWAADCTLADIATLRQRLTERERWLIREVGSTMESGWNATGDVKHGFLGGQPHPPLTLYSPALEIGYKAIHGGSPAAEIAATLRQVGQWIANRRVDDETEVSNVVIIADSRASALALRPRMVEAGVKHVVYVDDAGDFWDPFPHGEWIEENQADQ